MLQTKSQEDYLMKVSGMSLIFFVIAIVIAIKMKKGFWVGFGFSILGSMLGTGLGYVLFKAPATDGSQQQ